MNLETGMKVRETIKRGREYTLEVKGTEVWFHGRDSRRGGVLRAFVPFCWSAGAVTEFLMVGRLVLVTH